MILFSNMVEILDLWSICLQEQSGKDAEWKNTQDIESWLFLLEVFSSWLPA